MGRQGPHRPLKGGPALALGFPSFKGPRRTPAEPPDHGVLLKLVVPGGPAARAGLKSGDVLLSYDGKKLTTPESASDP